MAPLANNPFSRMNLGFPRGGGANGEPQKEKSNLFFGQFFSRKLHENEGIKISENQPEEKLIHGMTKKYNNWLALVPTFEFP